MKKSKLPWSTIVSVLVGIGLTLMIVRSVLAGPDTKPNAKDAKIAARLIEPKSGGDERADVIAGDMVAGNGIVEPADREIKVASQVSGRIQRVLVKEGDHVDANAPITELDNGVERAALAAAEADVEAAKAELLRTARGLRKEDVEAIVADTEGARARAQLSRDSLVRTEKLAQGGAATPDELDRARRQTDADQRALESSEAKRQAALAGSRSEDVAQAKAKAMGAAARRDQAQAQLDRLTVRAPIAGVILQLKYRAGEYYAPSGDPLAVMGDTSVLRVRMDVDERDVARVAMRRAAFATSTAFPGKRFNGKVVEVGKRMGRKNIRTDDPVERIDTKILEVVIQLDDKDTLVPGLRVVGYIATQPMTR